MIITDDDASRARYLTRRKLARAHARMRKLYQATPSSACSNADSHGWRIVDSMPCDGRLVLVYRPLAFKSGDDCIALMYAIGGNHYCWRETVPCGATPTNPTTGRCHVTHWMPLPEAPSATVEGSNPEAVRHG